MDNKVIIAIVAVVAVVAIGGGIAFAMGGADSDDKVKEFNSLPDDAFDNFDGTVIVTTTANDLYLGMTPVFNKMDAKDLLKLQSKEDGRLVYIWEIKGATSTQEGYDDFDNANFTIESAEFDTEGKVLKIDIRYKGVLPFPANVKYFVGDSFENGEEISVHNYYESVKDVDLGTFVVQNGYVEFTLTEC